MRSCRWVRRSLCQRHLQVLKKYFRATVKNKEKSDRFLFRSHEIGTPPSSIAAGRNMERKLRVVDTGSESYSSYKISCSDCKQPAPPSGIST